jgi:hypothetical protein
MTLSNLPFVRFSQNWAMRGSLAQFVVTSAQSQPEFVLQLLKISEFALYINQLCMESAANRSARFHASPPYIQEAPDLTEFESQVLDAPDKSKSLYVVLPVLSEAPLCPRRTRKQTIPLVEAYRVNTEWDSFRNGANLHLLGSFLQATPWSIVQSQVLSLGQGESQLAA